jgi:hypothetical protein
MTRSFVVVLQQCQAARGCDVINEIYYMAGRQFDENKPSA